MKKIKLLTSLAGLSGLSVCLIPAITGCSCNNESSVELDESVIKQNITLKSFNIAKDKESTIVLKLPTGSSISAITIQVGNLVLSKSKVTISGGKITIPADKMPSNKVIIKSITLYTPGPEPTVKTATVKVDPNGKWTEHFSSFALTSEPTLIEGSAEEITIQYTTSTSVEGFIVVNDGETTVYSEDATMGSPGGEYVFYLDSAAWEQITSGDELIVDFVTE